MTDSTSTSSPRWTRGATDLFLLSVLVLFAELVVIRWLASEVRIFAYLKNLPLLAAFFGLGLGCAMPRAEKLARLFPLLFGLLSLVIAFAEPLQLVHLRFPDVSVALWAGDQAAPFGQAAFFLFVVLAIFAWVVAAFAALGARLGALFDGFSPLTAYSVNVAGSLAGIGVFFLFSLAETGPVVWISATALLSLWFDRKWLAGLIWAATVALVSLAPQATIWSPYYRIDTTGFAIETPKGPVLVQTRLEVNHDYHQVAINLSPEFFRTFLSHPGQNPAHRVSFLSAQFAYDLPYRVAPSNQKVLVVGAGTGNDVAAALRAGARSIEAVEIDPAILRVGRNHHPEQPYQNPNVTTVVDDARAFFRRTENKYDLIVFGLLDSHTMFSSLSSLRLDNYVYTVESFREAAGHLNPDGILAVSFSVSPGPWIGQRLINTMRKATGQEPFAVPTGHDDGVAFFAGPGLAKLRTEGLRPWNPATPGAPPVRAATDDWPFLYIRPGAFPAAYLVTLTAILLGAGLAVRRTLAGASGRHEFDAHLFFMGAAFMLVETKSVAELSLLFGSTWTVNAAVFAGILSMILGANAIVAAVRPARLSGWFAGLGAAILLPLLIPVGALNSLAFPTRAALGACLVSLPIFFAGVIFATSFRSAVHPSAALASNLFGSLVGGVLEYTSMVFGIQSLNLVALVLYGSAAAALFLRGRSARATAASAA